MEIVQLLKRIKQQSLKSSVVQTFYWVQHFNNFKDRMKAVCSICNDQVYARENLTNHILSKHPNQHTSDRSTIGRRMGKIKNGKFKLRDLLIN